MGFDVPSSFGLAAPLGGYKFNAVDAVEEYPEDWRDPDIPRFWGVMIEELENGQVVELGFMRDTSGHTMFYPHPAIAQAHLDRLHREYRVDTVRHRIKEFTLV